MTEHYYSEQQTSPFILKQVHCFFLNNYFDLHTAPGIFSWRSIDKGTQLLIEKAIIKEGWEILDLGCGIGVVGIALAKKYALKRVVFSDVNQRAVKLASMNVKRNQTANAEVYQGDRYAALQGQMFDAILLNPPQTAGKGICFAMIEEAKAHLKHNGLLEIVARHNKGGKTLSEEMRKVFGNVKDIAKKGGYRVYGSENK